jgi:polyribonucleotide nucleotidyltransferase
VLATAVTSRDGAWHGDSDDALVTEYVEPASAANTIPTPGGPRRESARRESRASALVHRALRSVLSSSLSGARATNVSCTVLAADGSCNPDALAINAASASLLVSGVTCQPVAAVRVSLIGGACVLGPPAGRRAGTPSGTVDLLYAGARDGVAMMDCAATSGHVVSASQMGEMVWAAENAILPLLDAQEEFAHSAAQTNKRDARLDDDGLEPALHTRARAVVGPLLAEVALDAVPGRSRLDAVRDAAM